jgi:hypothetical protein
VFGEGFARNPTASGARQPAGMRFPHDLKSQSTGKLTHPARQKSLLRKTALSAFETGVFFREIPGKRRFGGCILIATR